MLKNIYNIQNKSIIKYNIGQTGSEFDWIEIKFDHIFFKCLMDRMGWSEFDWIKINFDHIFFKHLMDRIGWIEFKWTRIRLKSNCITALSSI